MGMYSKRGASIGVSALLIFGLSLSACGSSSSSNSSSDVAAIKNAWTSFFSGSTSAAQKVKLLQNGNEFAQIINEAAGLSISKTSAATVSKVVVNNSTATVTYSIDLGGKPALQNQTGTAVKVNGKWLVGTSSFCALLSLEGQSVPACGSSTSTTGG